MRFIIFLIRVFLLLSAMVFLHSSRNEGRYSEPQSGAFADPIAVNAGAFKEE